MPYDPWGDTSGTSSGYDPNKGNVGSGTGGGAWQGVKDWWNSGYTNDPNKPGGGGGGGGIPINTGSALATAKTAATTYLPWLQFAYAVLEGQKKGSFVMPPMTPEQKQMFDFAVNLLQGTHKQSDYAPILGYDLAHPATLDMAALKQGNVGFNPAQHMSGEQLAKILGGASTTPPPSTTTATTGDGSDLGGTPHLTGSDIGEFARSTDRQAILRRNRARYA